MSDARGMTMHEQESDMGGACSWAWPTTGAKPWTRSAAPDRREVHWTCEKHVTCIGREHSAVGTRPSLRVAINVY